MVPSVERGDLMETLDWKEKGVRENRKGLREPGFGDLASGELAPVSVVQGKREGGKKQGKDESKGELHIMI